MATAIAGLMEVITLARAGRDLGDQPEEEQERDSGADHCEAGDRGDLRRRQRARPGQRCQRCIDDGSECQACSGHANGREPAQLPAGDQRPDGVAHGNEQHLRDRPASTPPALRPASSATPASSPAHRVTVSLSLPPVSHASTATVIGTEAISRPLRELG